MYFNVVKVYKIVTCMARSLDNDNDNEIFYLTINVQITLYRKNCHICTCYRSVWRLLLDTTYLAIFITATSLESRQNLGRYDVYSMPVQWIEMCIWV